MQERENLLRIFQETKKAFLEGNSVAIKSLSNQTNNTASLTQDPDNIATAVIVYALSKIIERKDYYKNLQGWDKFYKINRDSIESIIDALKKSDDEAFRKDIKTIREAINKLSGKLKNYIQDVFRKATINRASKIYEHGISMEKTASLLGVTLFEIATYAGQKEQNLPSTKTVDIKTRINLVKEFFK